MRSIAKKFKVNGKAVKGANETKESVIAKLPKNKKAVVVAPKTYKIVNGVPVSIATGKPLVKVEK